MSGALELIRELVLRARRKRHPWRVSGASMQPEYWEGDLVLIDPNGSPEAGVVVIARHPLKNLDVIKYVEAIDEDDRVQLRSPGGDDSGQFGRVPLDTILGTVTINLTAFRRKRIAS